jgi:hypothetical protein
MRHRVPARLRDLAARGLIGRPAPDDRGQTTAEYVLVVLAAGTIAIGIITWAGSTHAFTDLFESVINRLTP